MAFLLRSRTGKRSGSEGRNGDKMQLLLLLLLLLLLDAAGCAAETVPSFDAFVIGDDEAEHLEDGFSYADREEDDWAIGGLGLSQRDKETKDAIRLQQESGLPQLDMLDTGNTVCVFLTFSHFSQFHQVLMQNQCGDVTMRVLEYESQRAQVRKEDMLRRQMRFQELGDECKPEDRRLFAKDEKKYKLQLAKQNKLMHVCLCVLLNLAEEISIERKMVNRKIPSLLIQLLDRSQEDLLLVTLTFLKKLSVFEENKDLQGFRDFWLAQHENQRIALLSLRLLFNLSFDERVRAALVESGIIKLLVDSLKNPPFRHIVLRLLYHFSMDDRCKSLMAYHRDGMVMLLQLVVHFPEPRVGKDLVALMVNLATHARAAEVIVQSGLFPPIMLRVMKHRDPLLCKVIRNVASHAGVLEQMCELLDSEGVRMAKWMNEFVRMAICSVDNPDFLVEVLGTLANVTLEEAAAALGRPASAPECRVPARPQFFWALRPEDVPDNMRSTKGAKAKENSPAYAHDPTSWLIHRHREGHLCAASFEADQRGVPRCPVERALQKPMGRPQSAPQILKERQKLRQLQDKKTAKRLGYWPGLPRKQVHSLFPKQPESDLPQVIARMQKLQAEQKALMQKKGDSQAVQLKKHRDVAWLNKHKALLKAKLGKDTRLLVNRWRPGYSEQRSHGSHQHGRPQSACVVSNGSSPKKRPEEIQLQRTSHKGESPAMAEPSADPAAYEVPTAKGSTFLGSANVDVLRRKATEPGHRIKFPEGFDDHKDAGVYFCAGCHAAGQKVPLYTSQMKFDCGCGWPGFWTNVKDAVYEQRDADGRRCEILCSRCDGHLGHVFRGEGFGYCTDERHCVNSLSLVFVPKGGSDVIAPSYAGPVFG
eukprot:s4225_g1.t1